MENDVLMPAPEQLPSLLENFSLLREQALQYIQQTSSATWTDHNIHDPGITIMEALCYALADVGFRMNFPMEDLLADPTGKLPDKAFYYPEEIFPCHAVTINDYRKLLIDLPLVRNAWIMPLLQPEGGPPTDYEPMYVDKKQGSLVLKKDILDMVMPQSEKDALLATAPVFILGLYAIQVEFETLPLLGSIDSAEAFEGIYEPDFFGDMYYDIGNWHALLNQRDVVKKIALCYTADPKSVTIGIRNSPKNKFNDTDGQLDNRVLKEWYYELDILCNGETVFVLTDVLFQPFFRKGEGISGTNIKKLLTQHDFGFFRTMFKKIQALAKAYDDIYHVLQANRNVCEDFLTKVSAIPAVELRVCADIDVVTTTDIEQVQAELFNRIEEYLSPSIPFHPYAALKKKGHAIEDMLEGPLLRNGFLLTEDMGPDSFGDFTIHLSDVINAVFEIPGLINCRNVQLTLMDDHGKRIDNPNPWEVVVPPGMKPVLNKRKSKFIFYKNDLPLLPDFRESILKLNLLKQNSIKVGNNTIPGPVLVPHYRDLALHYSLANEFPANYRIGRHFPDEYINRPELFTSKQLEGYLLLFDQLIANFLADLHHLKDTLSWKETITKTQYSADGSDWHRKYLLDPIVNIDTRWQVIVEEPDRFNEKRNAGLDFLLSRFAENLSELDNYFYHAADNIHINRREYYAYLHKLKQKFLADYVSISASRGAAVNQYSNASYFLTDVSGYENRISRLIGCDLVLNGKRKSASDINDNDKQERGYFHFLEHIMLRIPTLSDAMIIQLKANTINTELLSICGDGDCTACGSDDPYTFTASMVLPAWIPVYADMQYRNFIEKVIRRETPAGVLLRICWIDKASMEVYETLKENWWEARFDLYHSDLASYEAKLLHYISQQGQFVLALKGLRTEYAKATLHGCEDEGEENNSRIFLDNTFLGKP